MNNKRKVGNNYEDLACRYICENGAGIITRNFRCRSGEIDIIAMDNGCLIFAEVKYRAKSSYGHPEDAVNYRKQHTICRVSDYFRMKNGIYSDIPIRYDVITVESGTSGEARIRWLKNAFDYSGNGY